MKIEELQKKERRTVNISVRTTQTLSDFMKEKNLSPTTLFNKAVEELMGQK